MATDWAKEWSLWKRIYWWYMTAGIISIPFGIIYAFVHRSLGHDSKWALVVILAAAVATNYKIQGMPPSE